MEFLYKIVPYKSLFHGDDNTLTAWWILVTIAVFCAGLWYIVQISRLLKESVNNALQNFSEEAIVNDNLLKTAWIDYSETFIEIKGARKTDELSLDYFNEKTLLSQNINLKLLSSVPSTLVGLGILGTFVGLTYGITGFKTSSTDQIKSSIETLLSGMGTAFVSSIYGMFLSLLFTLIEKIQINSLHNFIHQLCYRLDKTYKITKEDERNLELIRQESMLSEYFIFTDENNNKVKPANIFRDIYEESKKQSRALQSFSTDLALKIDAGFEKLLGQQNELNTLPVLEQMQNDIKSLECVLQTEIKTLGEKLQDAPKGMTEGVVKDLNTSLAQMISDFKQTVTGSTKNELEKLAGLIADAGGSLKEMPNRLEETTRTMMDLISKISVNLNDKVGELQVGQEVLIEKQSANLQISDSLLQSFSNSIGQLDTLTLNVSDSIQKITSIQKELCTTAEQLKIVSENAVISIDDLKSNQKIFAEYTNIFLESNTKTVEEFQKALDKAKLVSSDYAQKFSIIEKDLKSIFEQIQTGLNDYRDSVGGSLQDFLGKYTEALTKTAEALAGTLDKQEGILEELSEQLSKLNGRRN